MQYNNNCQKGVLDMKKVILIIIPLVILMLIFIGVSKLSKYDTRETRTAKKDAYLRVYEEDKGSVLKSSRSKDKGNLGSDTDESISSLPTEDDTSKSDGVEVDEDSDENTSSSSKSDEVEVDEDSDDDFLPDNYDMYIIGALTNKYEDNETEYVAESVRKQYNPNEEPYSWLIGAGDVRDYIDVTSNPVRVIVTNPKDSSQTVRFKPKFEYSDTLQAFRLTKFVKLTTY